MKELITSRSKEARDELQKYLDQMIKDGYLDTDLEPIKCLHCESTDLDDVNHIVEELGTHVVTEYDKKCLNCEEIVGNWAYGYWQP